MFFNVFTYLDLKHLLIEPTGYACLFAHKPMDYLSIVGDSVFGVWSRLNKLTIYHCRKVF